jgi:hypothetical protein
MSNNIISWTVNKLDGFDVNIDQLYSSPQKMFDLPVLKQWGADGMKIFIDMGEDSSIRGKFDNDSGTIHVDNITCRASYSRNIFSFLHDYVFPNSRGYLNVKAVYEDGTVELISVDNGKIEIFQQ